MAGYGADATLVAAAYRLGQSNVPGDFTKIFEKQYQGLADAYKAKAAMQGKMLAATTDTFEDIVDTRRKKKEEAKDIASKAKEGYPWSKDESEGEYYEPTEEEKIVGNYTDGQIQKSAANFNGGSGLNPGHAAADEDYLTNATKEYERLSNLPFGGSAEDKKSSKKLLKQITNFRQTYNKDQAEFSSSASSWDKGFASKSISFKNQPELQMLWTQLMQGDANFAEKGIRVFRDPSNGKKTIEYTPGRMGVEMKSIVGDSEDYNFIPEDSKKKLYISQEYLLSQIKLKETKSENDFNAVGTQLLGMINETTTNPDNNTKVRTIKDFDSKAGRVERNYYDIAIATDNPNDIYTRELMVGDTPRIYAKDLQSNRNIDEAVINQIGIGSDVFTAEELKDGVIDPTELAKHKDAKAKIMEILTNPKTSFQKDIAAKEYAKYRTDMLKEVFNTERTRIDEAVKVETPEEIKEKERVYQQNSIFIQEQFVAAEKKGFTLDILNGLPIDKDKQFVKVDGKVYLAYKTSVGDKYKMVSDSPIDLKNKQSVLNILYQNSKIRPRERNIKVTGEAEQANYVNSPEYLDQFIIK